MAVTASVALRSDRRRFFSLTAVERTSTIAVRSNIYRGDGRTAQNERRYTSTHTLWRASVVDETGRHAPVTSDSGDADAMTSDAENCQYARDACIPGSI